MTTWGVIVQTIAEWRGKGKYYLELIQIKIRKISM